MGEEPRRVATAQNESSEQEVSRLRGEIEVARARLGTRVTELDRRRHELLDWRLQLKRHAGLVAGVGAGLALAIGGAIAYGIRREQKRNSTAARARRLKEALARAVEEPDRLAPKGGKPARTPGRAILGAVGATAASFVARRLMAQMVPARRAKA